MIPFLCILCILLLTGLLLCLWKIFSMRQAAEQLRLEFDARLKEDTNVGIDLSVSDKKMKLLAADMNRQLKLLRKEHIRYTLGDSELKKAVSDISHDLRTPLTAICGYMDLLAREEVSDTVREYLTIVSGRVQALKDLTEELFRYSVIMSVNPYEPMENLSLTRALEECLASYYGAFKKAGIHPTVQLPEKDIRRCLNPSALSRILSNIVSNAAKYSDGDFSVRMNEHGTMRFINHAPGLDEIQVGSLFDRFYTVSSAHHSTGLGLSIAKTLTEEMHGHIEACCHDGFLIITLDFPPNEQTQTNK